MKNDMKIRKANITRIMITFILSIFLFVGCGTDTTEEVQTESNTVEAESSNDKDVVKENDITEEVQIESNTVETESSNDKGTVKENDIKEEDQDKVLANENNVTDEQKVSSGKTDIYDSVIAEYSDMVQNDFYSDLQGTDTYDSSFGEHIGLEIRTHKQNIYYAFYDIDGNGTMELIIAGGGNGVSNPTFSPWNYDLYGYDGTKVVSIFPEMEFGYRTNFSLYENGVIEVFYSGSAAESGIDFYRIGNDGFSPELVDSFATVAQLEGDEPVFNYSQNGNPISESEYNAYIQSYEVALKTELDWIQIK